VIKHLLILQKVYIKHVSIKKKIFILIKINIKVLKKKMNSNNASESNAVEVTNKKNKVNGPKCWLRYKKN